MPRRALAAVSVNLCVFAKFSGGSETQSFRKKGQYPKFFLGVWLLELGI
jgi:hypothetical protein